mmetsp:Transcript_27117/g.51011  ORF Transcript_27117/g.51011 Transcript_27117/m.51011 type:complete len:289 (+) Transcript_27117:66-932(+)
MRKAVLVLACCACAGLGWQEQSKNIKSLATLLLEPNLRAAFNPSMAGTAPLSAPQPSPLDAKRRLGSSDPVMRLPGAPLRRRELLAGLAALAALPAREAYAAATGGGRADKNFEILGPKLPKELKNPPKPSKVSCKKCVPTDEELNRLAIGYKKLTFLLDNWDSQTSVCRPGCKISFEQCACERNPLIVSEYMGFSNINDPLYKIDDLMLRAQDKVSDADFDKFTSMYNTWFQKSQDGNVMAYVSSWGEANPGGGKDGIEKYLAKTRKEVVDAQKILGDMCNMLGVPI